MKILIVHYRFFVTGGPERYLFNLMQALEALGHEVIPFSIANINNKASRFAAYFARNIGGSQEVFFDAYPKTFGSYTDLLFREFYSFYIKRRLKKLIKDTQPDICYLLVYKRALSPSVIDACKEMNVPVINRISDYNPVCGAASLYRDGKICYYCLDNGDYGCLKYRCIKGRVVPSAIRYLSIKLQRALRFNDKIDAFVCTNDYMKNVMLKRKIAPSERINVIPTFFHCNGELKGTDKEQKIGDVIKFLYIGNLDESKGIYDLIHALSIVARSHDNFSLTIVGGLHKSENDKVMRLITELGLSPKIRFQPFRKDGMVMQYYLESNVTVLPTRWVENLPNTLIESIYYHRPVVVPNFGSFESTTSADIAFYFTPLSIQALAETIVGILDQPEGIRQKANSCEEFYLSHYSEKHHIETLLNLFRKYKNEGN